MEVKTRATLKSSILAGGHSSETFKCFRRILLKHTSSETISSENIQPISETISSETISSETFTVSSETFTVSSETLGFLLKDVCHIHFDFF
jgi:hypothetical protein